MAAAPEVNNNRVDEESKEYVADKGPVTQWELDVPNGCLGSFCTLRIFGLKLGFSTVTGVQGHYLLNTAGQMDDEPETQVFTAPCLMHFVDAACVPVYVLMFKWVQASGKIYALTIPMDVKLSSGVDAPDKWITPAMIKPVKLSLVSHFVPIENRDGQPLAKKLDAWIKDHFPHFAALKLKSLANCRSWLQPSSFVKHVPAVAGVIETHLRAEIATTAGLDEDAAKKAKANSQTNSAELIHSAQQFKLSQCLPLLASIQDNWALAASTIAVPLGHRLIELDLSAALVDEVLSAEKLAELFVSAKSPKHHETLLALLQKSDTAALLASGQKTLLAFTSSPFPPPAVIEIAPADVEAILDVDAVSDLGAEPAGGLWEEVEVLHTLSEAEEEAAADPDTPVVGVKSGRKRTATERLDNSAPAKKKEKKISKLVTPGTRGTYTKSGLFSKDPVKAAAARASLAAAGKEVPSRADYYSKGDSDKTKADSDKTGDISPPFATANRLHCWCVVLSDLKDQVKSLKAKVKEQDTTIAELKAKVTSNTSVAALQLSNMELKTKLDAQALIDEAWLKGFERCKDNFKALKKLQSM